MIKYRQALRAMSVLARQPFEFVALNEMTDAVSLSAPVQWWYRRLLADQPAERLVHLRELTRQAIDIDALLNLPESTLGNRYIRFCLDQGITPGKHEEAVPQLRETFEVDWVTHRFFKIHDILHTLTGFGSSIAEEMGLQMFDACNLREPYGIVAVLSTPYMMLQYGDSVHMLRSIIRGARIANTGNNLFFTPFEELWDQDFDEVRTQLGLA